MPAFTSGGQIPASQSPFQANLIGDVDFTIGAEGSNAIIVSAQLKTPDGRALTQAGIVEVYLATAATGATLPTAPSGAVAIATKGTILVAMTAKLYLKVKSHTDGIFDISITEAGAYTVYMIVVFPDGSIKASGAITFAA